jgi:type IV secretory pathway VirB10-like protein
MKIKDWSTTRKVLASVVAVIVVFVIIGAATGSSTKSPTRKAAATVPASEVTTPTPVTAPPTTVPPTAVPATTVPLPPPATTTTVPPAPPTPALTQQQQNAVQDAENYLSTEPGFSQQGLIQQLSGPGGDGFSAADATTAVDSLTVNWNAQAVDDAQNYNSTEGGFSCSGMIQQLSGPGGDGFTVAQATYGATQAGDC